MFSVYYIISLFTMFHVTFPFLPWMNESKRGFLSTELAQGMGSEVVESQTGGPSTGGYET